MLSTADGVFRPAADTVALDNTWREGRETVRVVPRARARQEMRARRVLNFVVAGIALVLTAPVFLIIAILVKATSRGPVFYLQKRVGIDRRAGHGGNWRRRVDYGGRLFTIYKFRTMYERKENAQVWARPDDPRITPVGAVLRKYRLDELPQLINVLRGEMNIVGPRPEQPEIFMRLRDEIQRYPERQRVLPGITGWAQVNHHYDQSIEDVRTKLQFDLEYAAQESAAQDLRIMLRTVPVMLFRTGGW
jgi:lipopolysaccharide/colanic/teichoic acid biosynthesis glycosyltransferase